MNGHIVVFYRSLALWWCQLESGLCKLEVDGFFKRFCEHCEMSETEKLNRKNEFGMYYKIRSKKISLNH